MKTHSEHFEELAGLLSAAIDETKRLLFEQFKVAPQTKAYKLFALIVANELLRKGESTAAMLAVGAYSGVNVVVRSAFESYADLLNLLKHTDTYPRYMQWASLNQQRSLFQSLANAPSSPFARALEQDAPADVGQSVQGMLDHVVHMMQENAQALPELYKNANGEVQSRDKFKFELANLSADYDGLYRHLSGSAHGRVSAMLEGVMHGEQIQWPPSDPLERPFVALESLCAMLLEGGRMLAERFDKPVAPLRRLARKQAKLRNARKPD